MPGMPGSWINAQVLLPLLRESDKP